MDVSPTSECFKRNWKNNISQVWPDVEVYFHGGVSFKPYKKLYEKLIPKIIFDIMKFIMHLKDFLDSR